jgi:hypothetical protein
MFSNWSGMRKKGGVFSRAEFLCLPKSPFIFHRAKRHEEKTTNCAYALVVLVIAACPLSMISFRRLTALFATTTLDFISIENNIVINNSRIKEKTKAKWPR